MSFTNSLDYFNYATWCDRASSILISNFHAGETCHLFTFMYMIYFCKTCTVLYKLFFKKLLFIAVKANHAWQLGDEHSSRKRAKVAMIFVILGIIAGISTYVLALTLYFTLNEDEPVSYHHSNTQAGWLFLITYIYLYTIVEWWKNRIRSKIYIHVYEEIRERVEWTPSIWSKEGAF